MTEKYKIAIYVDSEIIEIYKRESLLKKINLKDIFNAAVREVFLTEKIRDLIKIERSSERVKMQRTFFSPDEEVHKMFYTFLEEIKETDGQKKYTATYLLNVILEHYAKNNFDNNTTVKSKIDSKKSATSIHLRLSTTLITELKKEKELTGQTLGSIVEKILIEVPLSNFVPSDISRDGKIKITLSTELYGILAIMKLKTKSSIAEIVETILRRHYGL